MGGRLFGGCLTVRANLQFWAKPQVEAAQFSPQDRAFEKLESSSAGTELVPHLLAKTLLGQSVNLGEGWGLRECTQVYTNLSLL